ncbi:site-specific integrase [Acidithiobacillus thiooxidans]|jgi:integrase|uniref:site-specific integrase n=1 Tax=Acidithiobacillus thiooxidans TaxID=930 RepID=UPI001C0680BF|nr:site-specific integrase [Acidithiobacillus thiooxidans]MBU2793651.1 site-specific integrase [Acidithiobacillus thiooxidans]
MATIVKNPAGTWKAVIRKQGWPTAAKTFRTKRDAEDWARQTEDAMVRGVYIQRSDSKKFILDQVLDRYLQEITPTKKAGDSQRRDHTSAKVLRERLGKYALSALNQKIIGQYRDARLAEGRAGNTVRLELALLSHLFTVAIREWEVGLPANPVLQVSKPKGNVRDRRLQREESPRLLESVRKHSNPMLAWVTELALETAARVEEILSLEMRDVHLERRIMILRDTKNKDTRGVPLTMRAAEIFQEAIAHYPRGDSPLIFPGNPGRDGVRRPYRINKVWKSALGRASIVGLHFHDLRHEATSRFVEIGLSDSKVRQITGHKSPQMLARYAHLRAEDLVADLDQARGIPTRFEVLRPAPDTEQPVTNRKNAKIVPFPVQK